MIKYFCDICNKELTGEDLHTYSDGNKRVELCREHYLQITTSVEELDTRHSVEKAALWEATFPVSVEPVVEPVIEPPVEPEVPPEEPPVEPIEGGI